MYCAATASYSLQGRVQVTVARHTCTPGSTVTVASHAMGSETGPSAKTLNLAAKSTARGPAAPAAFAEQAARRHVEFGPGPSPPSQLVSLPWILG